MGQTTDTRSGEIDRFYEELAPQYDRMTAFESRLVSERPFIRNLVERYAIRTALDAGAGTGIHALLLAELGVVVTAVDLSGPMLARLTQRASQLHLPVAVIRSSFADLPRSLEGSFDALVCMGNTLAHCDDEEELRRTLELFRRLTRPGGVICCQMLNYDRILAERQSLVNSRSTGEATYTRSYEFGNDRLVFHVLTTTLAHGTTSEAHSSVVLRPWRSRQVVQSLVAVGFRQIETFGSTKLEHFDSAHSKDLVVLARSEARP